MQDTILSELLILTALLQRVPVLQIAIQLRLFVRRQEPHFLQGFMQTGLAFGITRCHMTVR